MLQINTVYCGDCLDLLPQMENNSVDMVLCDLPYQMTDCAWDSVIPLTSLWEQYRRIIKLNGAIVLTCAQPFTSVLISSNLQMFKYCWIWQKQQGTGFGNCKRQPLRDYEDVAVFYVQQPVYNPQFEQGKPYRAFSKSKARVYENGGLNPIETVNTGFRYPKQVLKFNWDKDKLHPTQKPLALLEYMVKTYTNEGDLILDNCAGSFSTAVACDNLNRNWICIEKELKYCEIGLSRINDNSLTLNKSVLDNINYG
jgi:site-specific DNA-methyltransferase (adenine-specific)